MLHLVHFCAGAGWVLFSGFPLGQTGNRVRCPFHTHSLSLSFFLFLLFALCMEIRVNLCRWTAFGFQFMVVESDVCFK